MPETFSEASVPDQSGRTIVITGANTGIGYEAARVLAGEGARVLLACRSAEKASAARDRICALYPKAEVELLALDLSNLQSVRDAAAQLAPEERLDLLINNAGIMIPPREETADGFESQFGVNHLGHFALTGLLLPKLRATPGARVVTVSSTAHKVGKIDFEDVHARRSYSKQGRYSMSKFANLLFAHELQRRFDSAGDPTLSVACHPGISDTELSRYFPGWAVALGPLLRLFAQAPPMGALPTLRAATDPKIKGGEYYGPSRRFQTVGPPSRQRPSAESRDIEVARRLWDLSVELTGVDPELHPVD